MIKDGVTVRLGYKPMVWEDTGEPVLSGDILSGTYIEYREERDRCVCKRPKTQGDGGKHGS